MEVTMQEAIEPEDKQGTPGCEVEGSAYELLQRSKSEMEEIVVKMLSIKKEEQPKSQLRDLITQMFLHFVILRQANRSILLEEDHVKSETERAKAPVDFTTLQLHNLMYERNHYVKAIKACKDFKSKYPDIDLVAEEEFFRDAPEEMKGSILSNDEAHNLMLKRLNFELFQRKELCKLHEKLEHRKKSLLETIANRKKFLSSLPSHLKSLKKASLPVQHQLGVLHTKKLKQHQLAELLPPPLYVIYSQFLAQKEAFGESIDMEIVGSVKDAQAFARQQANKDTGIPTNVESSRLEDDPPDDEDDGQRRRKRTKKATNKENLEHSGVYQVHPLKVILHIYDDEASDLKSSKLITLKFEFLLKLNVICVGIEGSHEGPENNILCNLFPDDTGLDLPHQSAKIYVGDSFGFDESRASRPYKWAQHLGGIDFLPEVSPFLTNSETHSNEMAKTASVISGLSLYRQQNRIQTVLERIRSRKKAQMALLEQLDLIMKLKWPILNFKSVPWAVHIPLCNLHSWSTIGAPPPHQVSSLPVVEEVRNQSDVIMNERSNNSKEDLENATEDGELPSLFQASTVNEDKLVSKNSMLEHSRQLTLISKSIISPISKAKSHSFKKYEEEPDLMLDPGSDIDEPSQYELEKDEAANIKCYEMVGKSWVDFAQREFCLVLIRDTDNATVKLEAKIKITMEYPLRPPLFALSIYFPRGQNSSGNDGSDSDWFNELRAMEAEVNLHTAKALPREEENRVLSHQVYCLAMLFDLYMEEAYSSSEMRKGTSVVEAGVCKPVSGRLLARSFRGRDRQMMMFWRDKDKTAGYCM